LPCNDVGESVRVLLDNKERIIDYSLQKRTCGKSIGEVSLIGKSLYGRTAKEILELDLEDFLIEAIIQDETQRYLVMKHFLAIQSVLSIYFGRLSGSVENYCTVESIDVGPSNIEILAHLKINIHTKNIKKCLA
jgi:hypothetical protein